MRFVYNNRIFRDFSGIFSKAKDSPNGVEDLRGMLRPSFLPAEGSQMRLNTSFSSFLRKTTWFYVRRLSLLYHGGIHDIAIETNLLTSPNPTLTTNFRPVVVPLVW